MKKIHSIDFGGSLEQFERALDAINLKILKFDDSKQRPVTTNKGTKSTEKFCEETMKDLSLHAAQFPDVWKMLHDQVATEDVLREYAKSKGILRGVRSAIDIPPEMANLTLNMDLTSKNKDDRFFLTHPDETISSISGENYLLLHGLQVPDAASQARKVVPRYLPRSPVGVSEIRIGGKKENVFNAYIPPLWSSHKLMPNKLPPLFRRLVEHLFPLKIEQEFFYDWLYSSLFKRCFTFLTLCGPPGSGKNRLKLVMRALHGHVNTVDGKKSTLVERFNSQLSEATLAWFDELHYDMDMENTMKELQNDSISIERKGVDATRATRIHASIVISNNKPRDNYYAFDTRKFVPLKLTSKRLEESMNPNEIDMFTKMVEDESSKTFNIDFIAQIAQWIKKRGDSKQWPNLEYRGPMFWTLAHTSMSRWQKKAVVLILESDPLSNRSGFDQKKKSFLWSILEEKSTNKNKDRSLQFPDYTTVRAFFEIFRDSKGQKAFSTEDVPGNNIMGDFWVKPLLENVKIITESSVAQERSRENEKRKKEILDL